MAADRIISTIEIPGLLDATFDIAGAVGIESNVSGTELGVKFVLDEGVGTEEVVRDAAAGLGVVGLRVVGLGNGPVVGVGGRPVIASSDGKPGTLNLVGHFPLAFFVTHCTALNITRDLMIKSTLPPAFARNAHAYPPPNHS